MHGCIFTAFNEVKGGPSEVRRIEMIKLERKFNNNRQIIDGNP